MLSQRLDQVSAKEFIVDGGFFIRVLEQSRAYRDIDLKNGSDMGVHLSGVLYR